MNEFLALIEADGQRFAFAAVPYAHDLALALFTISIVWALLARAMSDAPENIIVMLIQRGGLFAFIWFAISNWYTLTGEVAQSFQDIGQAITGVGAIHVNALLNEGFTIASTVFESSPGVMGLGSGVALSITTSICAFLIVLAFVVVCALYILTIAEIFLIVPACVLLIALSVCPWTVPLAEGSLSYAVRVGVRLLFLYICLGVGEQILPIWGGTITAACHPAVMSLPAIGGIPGAFPHTVATTICTTPIPLHDMLTVTAYCLMFAIFAFGCPVAAGTLVGHQVSLGLEHAASVLYISRSVVNTARGAASSVSNVGQTIGAAAVMQSAGGQSALQPPTSAPATPSAPPQQTNAGSGSTHVHNPPAPTQVASSGRQTATPLAGNTRPVGGETTTL